MVKYNLRKAAFGKRNKRRIKTAGKVAKKVGRGIWSTAKRINALQTASTLAGVGLRLMNVEKKRAEVSQGQGVSFGQFSSTSSGNYATDITPVISQGVTGNTRNGLSIKLVSACMDIQINQSVNTQSEFRYKWYIVCRPDASLATNASVAISQFFEVNPFSNVIDYHSNRDPEYFHQFRVLKSGYGKLTSDQISTQTSYNQFKIPLKLKHHLKYNTDASTTTVKNQMFLFVVADSGEVTALTGGQIRYNMRYYYVDN